MIQTGKNAPAASARSPILTVLAIGMLALPLTSAAQTAEDLANLDLEKLVQLPVEFVSGVSKYQESIRQAPASVTVFTSNDIRDYGWRTLSDALRATPGFHIRNDRFYEYIGNRGFTRPYDYNSRTLVLVDGHRINDPIYQQGSVGTDFLLDPALIDRIEIIRGPGSSVYGSSAFYGAINIIPKKGRDLSGGQASVSIDSTPGAKGRITYGNRTPSGIEYLISATASDSHGESNFNLPASWRTATSLTDTKTSTEDGTRQKQIYAHASWRGLETEAAYGRREKDVLPTVYDTLPGATAADTRAYWLIRASGQVLPDATFEAKTSIDYYSFDGEFAPPGGRRHSTAESISINNELRYHQTFLDGHSLVVGAELQNNLSLKSNNPNFDIPADSATPVDTSSSYLSPFAQLDYQLLRPLRLSIGGRYDNYSTGESRFTPRIGLLWDANRNTTLKLLYGESFRVPNLEERNPSEPGGIANPSLAPETNRSWELVMEHQLTSAWSLEAHLYHTTSSGLISYVEPTPGSYTYDNTSRYVTNGGEFGVAARFASGLRLRSSLTLQDTKEDPSNNEVSDSPHVLAKLNLSTPVYADWLRASVEVQYVGNREDFDTPRADTGDYLVANATLRAAPIWQHWEIALTVYNLADTRWSDPKNTGQITNAPRTAILRITRDF